MADQHSAADLRERVREHYAAAATGTASCCAGRGCGPVDVAEPGTAATFYTDAERRQLPAGAVAASLGCGNPLAVADLREGETVLDLGSGGGTDVLLSARRVGPAGRAYGLDMTDEMLALARRNAGHPGLSNVEFLKGDIEALPPPPGTVDVIISNCVINLSTDKPAVFAEAGRVLKPGGRRLGVTDIIAEDHLTPAERADRGDHVSCIAGALSIGEYRDGLAAAGFTGIAITPAHQVADGMHSANIRAVKPPAPAAP
jgi:arsenite methyltransferase